MSNGITRFKLENAVADAAADALRDALATPGQALAGARKIASEVSGDPRIAPALEPVSRFESQTIRGIVVAAGAPLLVAVGRFFGFEILESEAATALASLASLMGAAYAWYGRETTTRPLK